MEEIILIIYLSQAPKKRLLMYLQEMHGDRIIIAIFSAQTRQLLSSKTNSRNGRHRPRALIQSKYSSLNNYNLQGTLLSPIQVIISSSLCLTTRELPGLLYLILASKILTRILLSYSDPSLPLEELVVFLECRESSK
jgi:hypothetical protein